jgi:calpain-7
MSSDLDSIGKHIVTSGPYTDTISGVVTPQISLNPGKYLLVPSTYHPAVQVGFRLIAYCSTANVKITLRTPRT